MAKLSASLMRSRVLREFVMALEDKVPALREWHRFQYQVHFAQKTPKARLFSGVYESAEAALSMAPAGALIGHDHQEIAIRHTSESERMWPSDYAVLFWLQSLLQENSSIFDLGGAAGISFYTFKKYLPYLSGCKWIVHDVPAVTAEGENLAKSLKVEGLSFTTEFQRANDVDILLASGSLQFIEPSLPLLLSQLAHKPHHLLINRTPFCSTRDFVTLHNSGPIVCPYHIRNLTSFIGELQAVGYSLVDSWETPDRSCYIPFHPERTISAYRGMYLTRAVAAR
jgi:putative methyltransferase (TIGR04325 family)